MTVKELIEQLQTKPPTYDVVTEDDGIFVPITEVSTDHDKRRVVVW